MKKTLLGLLILGTTLMAKVTNVPVTIEFVESKKVKIIDIRTEGEWKQMGIIADAHLITFFDENAKYDINDFLKKLNKVVEKDEEFAIICNTASRTKLVSNFLGKKHDYNVINLTGGMSKLVKDGYTVEAYESDKVEKKVKLLDTNSTK